MKIIWIFIVSTFFIISCSKVKLEISQLEDWHEVVFNANDELKKIVIHNEKIYVFSKMSCYISDDLKNWQEISNPDQTILPFPVIFKDNLYVNAKFGLYRLEPDLNWKLIYQKMIGGLAGDNKYLYLFSTYGSYRSLDAINTTNLLNNKI